MREFPMSAAPHRIDLNCPHCGWSQLHGPAEIVQRLRTAGLLRSNSDATRDELIELLGGVADRLTCPDCGKRGLVAASAKDEDADWPAARRCESCGRPIPVERLEAVPAATLCAACQSGVEQGAVMGETEFCPRCGSPMVLRQTRSGGITRYVMACSAVRCRS
jgi:DNA-directed RNA polymerase subunit M/transcription elongation factor TFIIS